MEPVADLSLYVRLISGMILGLAVGKLLSGLAKFVQHPQEYRMNIVHALWIFFLFGAISVFWWEEAQTFGKVQWSYPLYLYQILYCSSYLFMTAVLLPDEIKSNDGAENHYEYFVARRYGFYGALLISHSLDMANLVIKEGFAELPMTPMFFGINGLIFVLLALGITVPKRWAQISVAAIFALLTIFSMVLE